MDLRTAPQTDGGVEREKKPEPRAERPHPTVLIRGCCFLARQGWGCRGRKHQEQKGVWRPLHTWVPLGPDTSQGCNLNVGCVCVGGYMCFCPTFLLNLPEGLGKLTDLCANSQFSY